MDLLDKLLDELGPYLRIEQYSLLYFVLFAIIVIVIHVLFTKLRFAKYIPGILLILYGLVRLFLNTNGGFLKSSPEDLRASVLSGACGLVSIFFARILAIMYKRDGKKQRRSLTDEERRRRRQRRLRREREEEISSFERQNSSEVALSKNNNMYNELYDTNEKTER